MIARTLVAPDDVAAWLELSAEEDRAGRPSAALDALEQARLHHAPLGEDLSDADRQREARLLAARGRARLLRGSASALSDLRRARAAGVKLEESELLAAELAAAVDEARHSDERRRKEAMAQLKKLAARGGAAAVARGALAVANPSERAAWARWLWERGAKRAAYDVLASLIVPNLASNPAILDDGALELWAEALAWWRPSWRGAAPFFMLPPRTARRCAVIPFPGGAHFQCAFHQVLTAGARSSLTEQDMLRLPPTRQAPQLLPTADQDALITLLVRGFLEGQIDDVTPALLRLVDVPQAVGSAEAAQQTLASRALLLRLAGDSSSAAALQKADASPPAATSERLLLAYEHLVRGDAAGALPYLPAADSVEASAPAVLRLRAVAEALSASNASSPSSPSSASSPSSPPRDVAALADDAAVRATLLATEWLDPAATAAATEERAVRLREIAARYRSDVAVARRKAADFVATSVDAAAAWAQLGALYLLLDDPASARAAWQAAVDKSFEARFLQGLAVAAAAAKDPDAALLFMTSAAAASGDPAPVLLDVAEELVRAGSYVHALQAARSAIDLAPLTDYAAALDVALRAARALGRPDEILALRQLGAATDDAAADGDASSPSAMARTIAASSAPASAPGAPPLPELLWIATRWQPRSVELRAQLLARLGAGNAARRAALLDELATIAAAEPARHKRAAAVAALRAQVR